MLDPVAVPCERSMAIQLVHSLVESAMCFPEFRGHRFGVIEVCKCGVWKFAPRVQDTLGECAHFRSLPVRHLRPRKWVRWVFT